MALGSRNHPYQRHQQLLSVTRGIYQQQQRPIAPAPTSPFAFKTSVGCYSAGTTLDSNNPSVVRRNARERNRVKQVNNGFSNLRQHLPPAIVADLSNGRRGIGPGAHKKLSKVDTLRMALEYIRRLQRVIEEVDGKRSTPSSGDAEQFYAISYAGSFGQQQHPHTALTSPATSVGSISSEYSSDASLFYNSPKSDVGAGCAPAQLKFEQSFDAQHCADEDDILDYITLWQEEM